MVLESMWDKFKVYLLVDVKLADTKKNTYALKSRFKKLYTYFVDKEFNRENFTQFIQYLKEQNYQPSHINNTIKIAKHYDKFLGTNCIQDYTHFHERVKKIEVLTAEQVKQIADVSYPYERLKQERNHRDYVVIHLLFATACRIGELQNLLWEDVMQTPVPNLTFRGTKNGEDRTVPITEHIYKLLKSMPRIGERVFDSRAGKMFSAQEFNVMLKKRAKLVDITTPVYAHIFRHSRITHLRSTLNFPIADVAVYVGHKDPKTTMRYDHPLLQQLSVLAYANPLDSFIAPPTTLGKLLQDYAIRLINKQFQNVFLTYPETGKIVVTIETLNYLPYVKKDV